MKKHKKFFLILLLLLFLTPTFVLAQDTQTLKAPFLPSLGSFCNLKDITYTPGENVAVSWIADCVNGLYHYMIVIGSVAAVIIIMIGGVLYISAAANPGYANTGKKLILGALFGIVLLLGSYLILNLINPRLVELPSIGLTTIEQQELDLDIIEQSELNQPSNWPVGKNVTATPSSVNEVSKIMFKVDSINGKSADGWQIWQSLNDQEKQEVLPYLKKQIAVCEETSNIVTINQDVISQWKGKRINSKILQTFINANNIAKSYGLQLKPGSIYRSTITNGIPLWNTGIVARYTQWRDKTVSAVTSSNWKTNQGKISVPKCTSPHNTGGAVDINLYDLSGNVLLSAKSSGLINSSNYNTAFSNDPYKVLLEEIMHQAGFVRFCGEHWHFEFGVTERYKRWNKTSRCWNYSNSIDKPIPEEIKQKVNNITQNLSGRNIYN